MSYWDGFKGRSESGRSPANDREALLSFSIVAFDERVTRRIARLSRTSGHTQKQD